MIDTLPLFEEFASIPRLFRAVSISEKIDGTNAQVFVPDVDDEPVRAGSRNRWLTVEADNFGFARWVADHAESLRRVLGPGRHFGEWWGAGIQRRYGLDHKRFSLFNATRWAALADPDYWSIGPGVEHRNLFPQLCVVPTLYAGPFSEGAVRGALSVLEVEGSRAAPGFMKPEGVVVFHEASRTLYKATLGGDGHKTEASR